MRESTNRADTPQARATYAVNDINWAEVSKNAGADFAAYGDAAIVTLVRIAGEGFDMPTENRSATSDLEDASMNNDYLTLNDNEKSLLKGLAEAKGKTFQKIIVLINTANEMETEFLDTLTWEETATLITSGQSPLESIGKLESKDHNGGVGVWANEQTIRENYLRAFEIPIVKGGAINTMTTFARFGVSLATTDYNLLTSWARGECGLKGFHVTDTWRAISGFTPFWAILMAGNNLPDGDAGLTCLDEFKPGNGTGNYGAIAQKMRESAHLILYTTVHSNLMNGIASGTRVILIQAPWQIGLIVADVVLGAALAASAVWILSDAVRRKK